MGTRAISGEVGADGFSTAFTNPHGAAPTVSAVGRGEAWAG